MSGYFGKRALNFQRDSQNGYISVSLATTEIWSSGNISKDGICLLIKAVDKGWLPNHDPQDLYHMGQKEGWSLW